MAEAAPAPARAARARTDARTRGPGDGLRVPGSAARPGVSVRDGSAATWGRGTRRARAPLLGKAGGSGGGCGRGAGPGSRRPSGRACGDARGLARTRARRRAPRRRASFPAEPAPRPSGLPPHVFRRARPRRASRGRSAALTRLSPFRRAETLRHGLLAATGPACPQGHVASHPWLGARIRRNTCLRAAAGLDGEGGGPGGGLLWGGGLGRRAGAAARRGRGEVMAGWEAGQRPPERLRRGEQVTLGLGRLGLQPPCVRRLGRTLGVRTVGVWGSELRRVWGLVCPYQGPFLKISLQSSPQTCSLKCSSRAGRRIAAWEAEPGASVSCWVQEGVGI